MDFLQRTPFFRLLLPFILGIIAYQHVELYRWSLISIFGVSLCLILLAFAIHIPKQQFKFRWLFGSGIFLFMLSLAYFLSGEREKKEAFDHLDKNGIYSVELIAAPIEKAKSYLCKVEVQQYYDSISSNPTRGTAILYLQKDSAASTLLFGDRLLVETEFSPPEKAQNPDGFDYAAYLKRQGVGATSYISANSWRIIGKNPAFSIQREADKSRNNLLSVYRKFKIEGDEFAVLAALTLGFTDELQPDLLASYSATGAMHILSVSGMHVGVVYLVMAFLFGFLNKSQQQKVIKTVLITLLLWLYAFLTGLSPSVLRATIMFTFVSVATCFERKSQIYNTLFMSAFFMLIYNPNFLYNVGFQLSYSAVLSIIFFQPMVVKLFKPTNKISQFSWDIFAVSIAAQFGTTPFTLYYFHQFPNYFLLTNLVAIPLSSLIIYLAIVLLIASYVPYLSLAVAFLLKWMLWSLNFLIVSIQHLPYSLSHISLDLRQMTIAFVAIFFFSTYLYTKKYSSLFIGLACLLFVFSINLHTNYQTFISKRMIVYSGQKNTHVNFINRNSNYIFTTDSAETEKIAKTFWQNQKLNTPSYLDKNEWFTNGYAYFEGSRILILNAELIKYQTTSIPLELDYLIIGQGLKPKIELLLESVHPRKIIVDKSISHWYTEKIKEVCKMRKIGFYSVAEKGAYILNFYD